MWVGSWVGMGMLIVGIIYGLIGGKIMTVEWVIRSRDAELEKIEFPNRCKTVITI